MPIGSDLMLKPTRIAGRGRGDLAVSLGRVPAEIVADDYATSVRTTRPRTTARGAGTANRYPGG